MNFKTTYILFGALALMVGALLLSLAYNKTIDKTKEGDRLFPSASGKDKSISADDITSVVIQRKQPAGEDLVLERDGKAWKVSVGDSEAKRELRADGEKVSSLVRAILAARIDEKNAPRSLKEGDLESPSRVVVLHGKERKLTLTIGAVDPSGMDADAYVLSSEWAKKPLAVKKRDIEGALEDLSYFRAKEVFGDDTADVASVAVSDAAKGTVELAKEKEHWRFVKPAYGDATIDQNWLRHLTDLKVDYKSEKDNDFVKDNVADVNTIDKDLAKSDRLRIEVGRGEDAKKATKTTLVVLTGKKLTEKGKDDKYYAYVEEPGKPKDVIKVSAKSVEPFVKLLEDPSSLRGKNLLALGPFAKPDAVDVKNNNLIGDSVLEFRRPEGAKGWTLYRRGKDGKEQAAPTDEKEAEALVSALSSPNAVTSFVDLQKTPKEALGLDRPGVVVKVWSNSLEDKKDEKKDEKDKKDKKEEKKDDKGGMPKFKKDAKPATELRFGKRDGMGHVAVERVWGGDSVVVMVSDVVLQQLEKNATAYYDKTIPPFSDGPLPDKDVTKVEFTRDGKQYEVTRVKAQEPWKFVKPEGLKGRSANEPAVRAILKAVNELTVRDLAAEKATDLEKYGLKSPKNRVVVTVTKAGKETKHEFDFGSEAQGKGVYVKVSGREPVYVVEDTLAAALKRELRDTTVFSFDADKVETVKLTGWAKTLGEEEPRTLEKKDGKWVIKEKPKLNVDQAKVKLLLEDLAHLKAESFVASGKGLDLKDDALQIEVTLPENKKVSLTVGAAEGENYYASSDQVKGEAFLIRKSDFEQLKTNPASLK